MAKNTPVEPTSKKRKIVCFSGVLYEEFYP